MTLQRLIRLIFGTGVASLAFFVAVGVPASSVELPVPQATGVISPSAVQSASVSPVSGGADPLLKNAFDSNSEPAVVDGTEAVEASRSVVVAGDFKGSSPQFVAQYPVTAAGYVMPIAGSGYEPLTEVVISGLGADGNPVAGITFVAWSGDGAPTVTVLDDAQATLRVTTDATGSFSAYLMASPYMASATVDIVAVDEKSQLSVADRVDVLGESAAQLNTSVDGIVAGEDVDVQISGHRFALSYKDYPVTLQLMRDGKIVTSQSVELSKPVGDGSWSSFGGVMMKQMESLEAGAYFIEAVVPDQEGVPSQFRGRVLASKAFTVTSADVQQSSAPVDFVAPSPGKSVEPGQPKPVDSAPTVTATPPADAAPTTTEIPPADAPVPLLPFETADTSGEQGGFPSAPAPVTFVMEQKPVSDAHVPAVDQNPAWIQTSSIRADDLRMTQEPNQKLKSSVLNAQGAKSVEGRINLQAGVAAPDGGSPMGGTATSVNLSKSTAYWPVLVLLLVALGVGSVTGAFISKATRANDSKK